MGSEIAMNDAMGSDRRQVTAKARRQASMDLALGSTILELLGDPKVTDIMLNPDGILWCERHGEGRRKVGELSSNRAESVIRLLASHTGTEVTSEHPMVSGVLPGTNARFQGVLPPVSKRPTFAIRKGAAIVHTLEDLASDGTLSKNSASILRDAIQAKVNMLIGGGTGSGKTTLANACLAEPACRDDRVVIIEDTRELQCLAEDRVELLTQPLMPHLQMEDLLRTTLRLFPRRIVIGEVRGSEALTMIKAWGTGHPGGLCTIHANSPRDAVHRLEDLIGEVAISTPRRSIVRAIGLIAFIEFDAASKSGRRVTGITRPSLGATGDYQFEDLGI